MPSCWKNRTEQALSLRATSIEDRPPRAAGFVFAGRDMDRVLRFRRRRRRMRQGFHAERSIAGDAIPIRRMARRGRFEHSIRIAASCSRRFRSSRTFAQIGLCDAPSRRSRASRCEPVSNAARGHERHRCGVFALPGNALARAASQTQNRKKRGSFRACVARDASHAMRARLFCVAASRRCRPASPAGPAKKSCAGLLTAEKTVIRFRPADVACRSE
jgi:hypothetical protein